MGFFTFVEEDEDNEVLDLEDVVEIKQEVERAAKTAGFQFEDDIPERRTLADPEVKARAAEGRTRRRRRTSTKDYAGKRADGWSYCCAHREHLSNLCERIQVTDHLECKCGCHEERGFDLEDAVRRYEDEEVIELFA